MSNTAKQKEPVALSHLSPLISSIHPFISRQVPLRPFWCHRHAKPYRVSDRHGIINESPIARGPLADEVLSQHLLPFTCTSTSKSQVLPASCPLNKTIKVRSSSNLAEGPMAAKGGSVFNRDPLILNPLVCARHQGTPLSKLSSWKARCPLPMTFETLKTRSHIKPCHKYSKAPEQKAISRGESRTSAVYNTSPTTN